MIFERDSWQEIFATIRKNKLRTALTMLGVFWGIFMLVVMLGCGNGLRNGILKDFSGIATNSFFLWAQQTNKAYKGMKPGRRYNFNLADWDALKQLKELTLISPINQLGGHDTESNITRGLKTATGGIQACYPTTAKIGAVAITNGRFLNDLDLAEKRKVCVIGPRIAQQLFRKGENCIGQYIRVSGVYLKVIGVTKVAAGGDEGFEQATRVHIPFTTFRNAFNYGDIVGWFEVQAVDGMPADVAEKKVITLLKERHKIAPDDMKAIGHWNMEIEYNKMKGLFTAIEILIWIVGSGTLLAGVIGISNIMLIVVKERTKEIGVKRALGAIPSQIIGQILTEAIFLTAISGYFGLVAGVGFLEFINSALVDQSSRTFSNPTVDLSVALKALFILVLGGTFAGFIPARRAVSIKPVDALRSE